MPLGLYPISRGPLSFIKRAIRLIQQLFWQGEPIVLSRTNQTITLLNTNLPIEIARQNKSIVMLGVETKINSTQDSQPILMMNQ